MIDVIERWRYRAVLFSCLLLCAGCGADRPETVGGDAPAPSPSGGGHRMDWWREARFGMFLHWGLYALPAGEWKGQEIGGTGEWIMNTADIPVEEYETLAASFLPVSYDPAAWARAAREAGAKYVVITSKHHDGFCLFDSAATDYDVVDATPWAKDLLVPLAEACRREGLRFGVYYSIMDWHHPAQVRGGRAYNPTRIRPGRKGEYTAYMKAQIAELVECCRPAVLWFDGDWPGWWTAADGRDLYDYVRGLDPGILINNRVGTGRRRTHGLERDDEDRAGDFGTPEQRIPATGLPGVDWETCMTMNDTWGYKKNDTNWKSGPELIRNLADIASKGGNFLLNVGPTADGRIPGASLARLREMGEWLAVNGEAVYGTSAGPFERLPWGRCTRRTLEDGGTRLYLHVFDWPESGRLTLHGLRSRIRRAYLLAGGEDLEVPGEGGDPVLLVPPGAGHEAATVVVLDIEGEPQVVPWMPAQDARGVVTLVAEDGRILGTARVEPHPGGTNIGYWTDSSTTVIFPFRIERPGPFRVDLVHACRDGSQGSTFEARLGGSALRGEIRATGPGWHEYVSLPLGTVVLQAGEQTLEIVPLTKPRLAVMNLKSILLTPARDTGEGE